MNLFPDFNFLKDLFPYLTTSRILVVREKSSILLQALRAAATTLGSGTRSMATRSAIPFLSSQPSRSALAVTG